MSADWVALTTRFTPGWPWPESSFGMDPRYGSSGWCHECGTPTQEQTGALTIQGSKFPTSPVWMPNWMYDVVCVDAAIATEIIRGFEVQLGDIHKPRTGATGAMQIIPSVTANEWHDPAELAEAVIARHGDSNGDRTGNRCGACETWKWLPVGEDEASVRLSALEGASGDVVASPETFGDGLVSFTHLLFRRALGELLVAAHSRHWSLVEVSFR